MSCTVVMKFGGTSVADAERLKRALAQRNAGSALLTPRDGGAA